jgi:hypothetical protein
LNGFVRDFRLNNPEALSSAKAILGEGVYGPATDPWITLSDLHATQRLAAVLEGQGIRSQIVGGREVTDETLGTHSTILIGHPRGIPWLVGALSDLNFHFRTPPEGQGWSGALNRNPAPGESASYRPSGGNQVQKVSEAEPDYGLLTRRRMPSGRLLISIVGNRSRTSWFLGEKLTKSEFLQSIDRRVPQSAWTNSKTVQLLFQVRDLNRDRMDAVYLTGRIDDKSIPKSSADKGP